MLTTKIDYHSIYLLQDLHELLSSYFYSLVKFTQCLCLEVFGQEAL